MPSTSLDVLQAAMVAQIALSFLVLIAGTILFWNWDRFARLFPLFAALICLALFIVMFLIRDQADVIFWGLLVDLIIIAFVVGKTGGSEISCFVPLYLMLPTYAVVVGESLQRVAYLYIAALILFVVTFSWTRYDFEVFRKVGNKIALGLVTFVAFSVTYFLDWRAHEAREIVRADLNTLRSKYEVGKTLEELEEELSLVDIDAQQRIVRELIGKHVSWTVRFASWYSFGKSKDPDPKTLKFAIQHAIRRGQYPVYYGIKAVDLSRATNSPPELERGESYTVDGILVQEGYGELAVLAIGAR